MLMGNLTVFSPPRSWGVKATWTKRFTLPGELPGEPSGDLPSEKLKFLHT
jgi:hypothetical protein